ncbi:MAG: hypothetical protein RJB38_1667 [Pseudomonadota bacterium]|jgi:hypothetical protein
MEKKSDILVLLEEHLNLAKASSQVLMESHARANPLLNPPQETLTPGDRETLEALTARFSRLSDFLVQRLFRTLDEVEMQSQGTVLDSLNRMEKRGIIESVERFREIRALRKEIAHEYLIEKTDRVVRDAFDQSQTLFDSLARFEAYARSRGYLNP